MQHDIQEIIEAYFHFKKHPYERGNPAHGAVFRRYLRPAQELLDLAGSRPAAITKIKEVSAWASSVGVSWTLHTVVKRFFEDHPIKRRLYYVDSSTGKKYSVVETEQGYFVIDRGVKYRYTGKKSDIKSESHEHLPSDVS